MRDRSLFSPAIGEQQAIKGQTMRNPRRNVKVARPPARRMPSHAAIEDRKDILRREQPIAPIAGALGDDAGFDELLERRVRRRRAHAQGSINLSLVSRDHAS
jgi:hypothetical protein